MVETGFKTKVYGALQRNGPVVPFEITRRAVGDDDIHVKIAFAAICHTDIHHVKDEWGDCIYPCVPGHEIAGFVEAIGKNVTDFKVGDRALVGCLVECCRSCEYCKKGEEQYCKGKGGFVGTYNHRYRYPHCPGYDPVTKTGPVTYGGYS